MVLAANVRDGDAATQAVDVSCEYDDGDDFDPLSADLPTDPLVVTSLRRLRRIAIVACDTGTRFAREGLRHDPAAWMFAPRALFEGATALEACQERGAFVHATLLHGLSLGLDAQPGELDALLEDGDRDDQDWDEQQPGERLPGETNGSAPPARLFTGTLEGPVGSDGRCVQAFCAMVTTDEGVVRRCLRIRYGERLGNAAVIGCDFDPDGPVARALLSASVRRTLSRVALHPSGAEGEGLDLHVEQRFQS